MIIADVWQLREMADSRILMLSCIFLFLSGASDVPLLSTSELLKGILEIPHFVMFYNEEDFFSLNRLVV